MIIPYLDHLSCLPELICAKGGENEVRLRFPMISSNLFLVINSLNRIGAPSCMLIGLVGGNLELPGHGVTRSHVPMKTKNSPNYNSLFKIFDVSSITVFSIHCLGIKRKKYSILLFSHGSINFSFYCIRPELFLAQNPGMFPDQFP